MIPRKARIALSAAVGTLSLIASAPADARQFTRMIVHKLDKVHQQTIPSPQLSSSQMTVSGSRPRVRAR